MESDDKFILEQFDNEKTRNQAFELLVKKYQERLYWHIRRMVVDHEDANDVIQNVFIKVFGSLDKFRRDSQLYTWLYRIATNECLTFLKKKKYFIPIGDAEHELNQKLSSGEYISGDEISMKLQRAILTLPAKQRSVFNMRYYDEIPYEDMAKVTGTSVGALKASYHHAVKKIEKYLKGD